MKGNYYIAILLNNPNVKFHPFDLSQLHYLYTNNEITYPQLLSGQGQGNDCPAIKDKPDSQELLIGEIGYLKLRDRESRLEELLEADNFKSPDEKIIFKDELSKIVKYKQNAIWYKKKGRYSSKDEKNAKDAVTKCIKRSISLINNQNKNMGSHLDNSVKCGKYFQYEPDRVIEWKLES